MGVRERRTKMSLAARAQIGPVIYNTFSVVLRQRRHKHVRRLCNHHCNAVVRQAGMQCKHQAHKLHHEAQVAAGREGDGRAGKEIQVERPANDTDNFDDFPHLASFFGIA